MSDADESFDYIVELLPDVLLELQESDWIPFGIEYEDLETLIQNMDVFQCFQKEGSPDMFLDYVRGDERHLTMDWNGNFTIDDHIIPQSDYQR